MHVSSWMKVFANVTTAACFVIVLIWPIPVSAGININVEYVKKSVVFLYGSDAAGEVGDPLGTGFIVEVPISSQPGKVYKLLVTARHMVDPQWTHCATPTKLFMRVNKKNFDPAKDAKGTGDVELAGHNVASNLWFVSPDPEVDAAVMILNGPVLNDYDVGAVRVSDFPTPEELKAFAPGDAVVSAGLLLGASGKKRNYPIFKFGNISSIPDESADAPGCTPGNQPHFLKLWFVAANLVPGNSGSPVYYVPSGFSGMITVGTNNRAVLLGVQSISFLGWDVAGMTPVQYVYEIIENMKLPGADLRRNIQMEQAKPSDQK